MRDDSNIKIHKNNLLIMILIISIMVLSGIGVMVFMRDNNVPHNNSKESIINVDVDSTAAERMRAYNAVIVKWGNIQDKIYYDTSPAGLIRHIAVGVEVLETFEKTFVNYYTIRRLYIPEFFIDNIKEGDVALLFVGYFGNIGHIHGQEHTYGFNARSYYLGQGMFSDKFPIFPIIDGKITIPENFHDREYFKHENSPYELFQYDLQVMNTLKFANEEILSINPNYPIFKSGISIEELRKYFDIIFRNR